MSEIQTSKYAVEHRNSLSNKSPLMMNGVSLRPLREGHVLHLLSAPEMATASTASAPLLDT